ncbi:MAG: acyl-CoA synthetase (AMP-forming)/AMP-acid ligase II [Paraglaciecola sp.]|jgi:acyl-CoA synthetase (AMP-forming)/AMP-acid ligase II
MGELAIGGAGVANGYFNQPQLTQSRFIDNPFGPGKLYLTGDLATKDQHGNIHYHGRDDNQIKWRGYRIELDEIVQTLQQHSAVNVAHCRLQQDWLLCYYTTSDSQPHPDEALKDSLRQWLPEYMLPSQFIHLEQMPLSNSGKIDNCALAGLQHQAVDGWSIEQLAQEFNASQKHLLNLAQCHQTSRFSVMMSLYVMVLARYANQDEVCIGTPIANRHIAGSESIIGLFANTVVYRCQLTANRQPPFY